MITDEIANKNDKFFDINILLLLCLYYLKINNILFLRISKTTLYLFIYNFLKIKSCFLILIMNIKYKSFL